MKNEILFENFPFSLSLSLSLYIYGPGDGLMVQNMY